MGLNGVLTTATRLRMAVAFVVVFVSTSQGLGAVVLPWALLVVSLDLVAGFLVTHSDVLLPHRTRAATQMITAAGAYVAGLSLVAGDASLPLFVIPMFRAGEHSGRRGVAITGIALAAGALSARMAGPWVPETSFVLLWVGVAASLGILAAWEDRLSTAVDAPDPVASEAAVLLDRLAELSSSLDGGLDPALPAERMLDGLTPMAARRSAVLAGPPDGPPVPVALRGATRVPWPQPQENTESVLGRGWCDGEVAAGHESGRAILTVPLHDAHGAVVGALVTDWPSSGSPTNDDVARVLEVAERHAPSLTVALSYNALREEAGLEERRQLAKSMHDGIAQDVAAVGFQLDMVRYAAQQAGDATAGELGTLRAEVARILGDLRTDITDLRVGLRPEHGLGAAVSQRLQQFGAATGATVRVALKESGFRLPAATEVRLYRLVLDVLADAQRHQAREVDAELTVSAPHFALELRFDSTTSLREERLAERLEGEGSVFVEAVSSDPPSTRVVARLRPDGPDASARIGSEHGIRDPFTGQPGGAGGIARGGPSGLSLRP